MNDEGLFWQSDYETCFECSGELRWVLRGHDEDRGRKFTPAVGIDGWEVHVSPAPNKDDDVCFELIWCFESLARFDTIKEAQIAGMLFYFCALEEHVTA